MAEIRLNKITRQFNLGLQTLVDFLNSKGANIAADPNAKISDSFMPMIESKFGEELKIKQDSEKVAIKLKDMIEKNSPKKKVEEPEEVVSKEIFIKTTSIDSVGKEVTEPKKEVVIEKPIIKEESKQETVEVKPTIVPLKIVDKIDLSQFEKKKKEIIEPKANTNTPNTAKPIIENKIEQSPKKDQAPIIVPASPAIPVAECSEKN